MRPSQRRVLPGLLLLLVAMLPAAACAADSIPFGQGLLWRIERNGAKISYVFGTMHSTDPRIVSLPAAVAGAFEEADRLVVEAVLDETTAQRTAEIVMLPEGRSLDRIIGAALFAEVADIGALYRLPAARLQRIKPWAVALMFARTPAETMRMASGERVLDWRLEQDARAEGKPVYGLETPEEQLRPFDELSREDQRRLLETVVDVHPRMEALYVRMKRAYLDRDTEALFAMLRDSSTGGDEALARWFEDRIVTQRNYRMAERLRAHLAEGGAFIAVGALHLPGEEGLLRLLERQGNRVTRIY